MEEYYETDSSDNEENHSKLLSSVSQLDSTQRVKPAQRKEITSKVSEYNLTERIPGKKNLISANELANVLGKSSKHGEITKKFKNVTSKSKTLPRPLEKPLEEQIIRSIGFENVKNQLRRWNAVVTRNALKDQIKFPLNDNSMIMQKSDEFLSQFQSSTPLEDEIMKVLKQEKNEEEQEDKEFSLTVEEMLEKRREMAYLRAKLSHREAKAQRQNKIKSKKYHRILKREKLRQQLKEFELLQKTDPEAALKKLSELDKTRAQERASLRHRNTGQWAKNLSVRAKYDVESRKILAEQLKISRELTQKVHELDDSDKEDPEEPIPWNNLRGITKCDENPGGDIDTLFEELDEQLMENAKLKVRKFQNRLKNKKNLKSPAKGNVEVEFDLSLKNKNIVERPDLDVGLIEGDDISLETQSKVSAMSQTTEVNGMKSTIDIDPDKYIQVKPKRLRTHLPDNITSGEDNLDNEKKQVMTIEEAFVDDDVVAQFKEMKEESEKSHQIEIETSLPGWGEWGGLGIVSKVGKNPRLVVNVPPRKDKDKKDTIINENANPNLRNHLVKEVCHPFKSVEAFEANIRAPVGREWVPETAHWKLIQKQVETKLGAVIDPMDEDEIIREKKNHKSPYQGKMRNQKKKIA